jgi:class 3 adenylate cyclase
LERSGVKCPRCQAENPPGTRFCGQCAAPLASVCPSCGASNPPENKFCGQCAAPIDKPAPPRFTAPEAYTPKHLAEKILTSKAALEGERKQVTVLFADLKGSMELLADRDPEEARKLLDPVLERMMEAVHRYEGTVNQVMGDGIMALFGAPLAHEDHAVRGCYAALRMQASVKQYAEGVLRTHGIPVRIRVGLNSGDVVVRSIGSDLHMDYTAVGQTTHLAARMEQMANPGATLLTADTLHLAEGFVQVQSLGEVAIKGLATRAEIFELTGASPVRSRLQAAAARGLTPFVGRAAEMDTLFTALEQAKAGKGQVVAVVGDPGVGKSRLFWEFTHSHRTQGCLVLEAASVSYGKATTYLPVIDLLKDYFQIEARDETRRVREKVTGKLLSLDRTLESGLGPLLWVLDVPMEDAEWERLDPPVRRQRLLDGLRRLALRESQVQPLVLVFEDVHWIPGSGGGTVERGPVLDELEERRIEGIEVVTAGLGGPDVEAEEADDLGVAVVAAVGVDQEGVEEVGTRGLDLVEDVVLVALGGVLEGRAVARVAGGGDGAEAFQEQPAGGRVAADGILDVRAHAEVSRRGDSLAGGKQPVQHSGEAAPVGLDEGAHARRASSTKRSAM